MQNHPINDPFSCDHHAFQDMWMRKPCNSCTFYLWINWFPLFYCWNTVCFATIWCMGGTFFQQFEFHKIKFGEWRSWWFLCIIWSTMDIEGACRKFLTEASHINRWVEMRLYVLISLGVFFRQKCRSVLWPSPYFAEASIWSKLQIKCFFVLVLVFISHDLLIGSNPLRAKYLNLKNIHAHYSLTGAIMLQGRFLRDAERVTLKIKWDQTPCFHEVQKKRNCI